MIPNFKRFYNYPDVRPVGECESYSVYTNFQDIKDSDEFEMILRYDDCLTGLEVEVILTRDYVNTTYNICVKQGTVPRAFKIVSGIEVVAEYMLYENNSINCLIYKYTPVTLFFANRESDKCSSPNTVVVYMDSNSFTTSNTIVSDLSSMNNCPPGYYREIIWRYWDGTSFTDSGNC